MTLYPIHTMGISAWCSDLIIDPEDLETIYFISLCGYQITVKGIVANLLENSGISIEVDGVHHYLMRSVTGYKVRMKKLPSGLVHAVLLPKPALPSHDEEQEHCFLIITRDEAEIHTLFFLHLDEMTELPLHPSWSHWLWKTFQEQEDWLVELTTLVGDYKGYLCTFHPTQLHDLISEAIQEEIPEIIHCMTEQGDNQHGTINLTERLSE